jgi:tripartite-type tricarboxylate transporter receptor subunit TctC
MKKRFSLTVTLICIGIFLCAFGQACAQDKYPTRPIEIVTSFPPGGLSEMWVRTVAKYMEKLLGQPIVNLPKPGGGNVIGFTYVANARPDGYTLLNQGDYFMPILNKTATFKLEDLRVIAQVSRNGNVLCVAADAPWKTYKEFVDYSKKNGDIKYGHPGLGTNVYFRTENLNRQAGLRMVGLPRQGDAEIATGLLGKHIAIGALSVASARPLLEAGKLRALFSFDPPKDFGLDPSIPDFASVYGNSFPDIPVRVYLIAPVKTPETIIKTLEKTIETMCKDPGFIADIAKMNQKVEYVPGKTIMESHIPVAMKLVKEMMADQPPAK